MKKINLLLLALIGIFGCMFTACDEDEPNVAKAVLATVSSVTFDGEGAPAQVLTVYSDAAWTVSDYPEWLTVEPTTGTGTTEVSISVTDNMRDGALDRPRYADLVFKGATKASEAHVSITQAGDIFRDVQPISVDEAEAKPDKEGVIINDVTVHHLTASGFVGTSGTRNLVVTADKDNCPAVGACVNLYATKGSDDNRYAVFALDHVTEGKQVSALPEPVDITAELDTYKGTPRAYVSMSGKVKGKDITVEGASNQGYVIEVAEGLDWAKFSEHNVTVKAYYCGTAAPAVRLIVVDVEDHGMDINYVFRDDFEWLDPWSVAGGAGQTVETDNLDAKAPNLHSMEVDGVTAYQEFESRGYQFVYDKNDNKRIYLQQNYLKFGKTGNHAGIVIPAAAEVPEGNLTFVFDWCPMRQGSGKIDPVNLVVKFTTGGETTEVEIPTHGWENDHTLEWIHETVDITGSGITYTKETTITITQKEWEVGTANRWFLDNIGVIVQ